MELEVIFYPVYVTNVANKSQPCVCMGGGLHAPIHIYGVIHMPGLAYEAGVYMHRRLE